MQWRVSISIGNSALSGEDLGHVIILDIGQGLLVILVTSAGQVMQVVNKGEDLSVHHHLGKGHHYRN